MLELMIRYEWAILFLGVIAFGLWELYALHRDKRRSRKGDRSESDD